MCAIVKLIMYSNFLTWGLKCMIVVNRSKALVNSDQFVTELDKSEHPYTYITERHTFHHHTTAVATL